MMKELLCKPHQDISKTETPLSLKQINLPKMFRINISRTHCNSNCPTILPKHFPCICTNKLTATRRQSLSHIMVSARRCRLPAKNRSPMKTMKNVKYRKIRTPNVKLRHFCPKYLPQLHRFASRSALEADTLTCA